MDKSNALRFWGFLCLLVFLVGVFFLSPNFTGNVIGGFEKTGSDVLGLVMILLSIGGYYFVSKLMHEYV